MPPFRYIQENHRTKIHFGILPHLIYIMIKKVILYSLAGLLLALLVLTAIFYTEIRQSYFTARLFDEDRIVHNFSHMSDMYPSVTLERSGPVFGFGHKPAALPDSFTYQNKRSGIEDWIEESRTTALVVVKDNDITYENYYLGTGEFDKRISWSVAKSFLSALFGVAVHEGLIPDLNVPVNEYVPTLNGTGYEGVTIKNALQMSSGVYFNEDYGDPKSDINRFGRTIAWGRSFDDFAASLQSDPDRSQGAFLHYVSIDTHVLGMVLRAATGKTIKELFEQHMWSKMGMEEDAYFITDGYGEPMVLGGLNMITRDYARMGVLVRDDGFINGEQIIPEAWLSESVTPDAPHLIPGERETSLTRFGYGYQWWIPEPAEGFTSEIMAKGIYNQYIYINPEAGVVIAKNSANIDFQKNFFEHDYIALSAFREIVLSLTHSNDD